MSLVSRAVLALALAAPTVARAQGPAPSVFSVAVDAAGSGRETTVSELLVRGAELAPTDRSVGQTVNTIGAERFAAMPAANIGDILVLTPGVTFAAGNGPRDISISVRGSNARQTFGVRNLQVFEDGFPVTQPDGLARTDLTDPHAYSRIDVIKGPSSALYGNYATGGAIAFHTRPGRDLNGVEIAFDTGSDQYRNIFATLGAESGRGELSAFASFVSGVGFRQHTGYRTGTINALATFAVSPNDRLVVKLINNDTDADLSIRQSLAQFRQNPYQQGCQALAAPGCASVNLFTNGFNGARQNVSAVAADLQRNDRRSILGLRWEHDFTDSLTGRAQLVWDNRDIQQPTGATAAIGVFPSYNLIADMTWTGDMAGYAIRLFAGVFYNTEDIKSGTYNVPASGTATVGALTQLVAGDHTNYGARARAEIEVGPDMTLSAGIGAERTRLKALQTAFAYPTAGGVVTTRIAADRTYTNLAPDLSLAWRANEALTLRGRIGGGYGTPQATNLFITAAGVPGNNTALEAQSVIGLDLGADLKLGETFTAGLTVFHESFRNELVSQSAGANLQSFTFNAPRSRHRGVELAVDWTPLPELVPGVTINLAYLHDDQTYRSYVERISAGAFSAAFDRAGKQIPGVPREYLNARVAYRTDKGLFQGLAGYVEWNIKSDTWMDNANLLKAPGYSLVNLGISYDPPPGRGGLSRLRFYASVQNLADKVYVGSASNIADSLNATTGAANGASALQGVTGAIYAGAPRTLVAGVRARF